MNDEAAPLPSLPGGVRMALPAGGVLGEVWAGGAMCAGESSWDGERACAWGETERDRVSRAGSETERRFIRSGKEQDGGTEKSTTRAIRSRVAAQRFGREAAAGPMPRKLWLGGGGGDWPLL